jgi:hypothetical protein
MPDEPAEPPGRATPEAVAEYRLLDAWLTAAIEEVERRLSSGAVVDPAEWRRLAGLRSVHAGRLAGVKLWRSRHDPDAVQAGDTSLNPPPPPGATPGPWVVDSLTGLAARLEVGRRRLRALAGARVIDLAEGCEPGGKSRARILDPDRLPQVKDWLPPRTRGRPGQNRGKPG